MTRRDLAHLGRSADNTHDMMRRSAAGTSTGTEKRTTQAGDT